MTKCVSVSLKYTDRKRREIRPCIDCGKQRIVCIIKGEPQNLRCKSCAVKLSHKIRDHSYFKRGKDCYQWKGGRFTDSWGYISIWVSPDDPYYAVANKEGRAKEHRLIMSRHLGRCLHPWEIVHHINGIKDDNRIENLELLPTKAYHVVDSYTKSYIARLEKKILDLELELIQLKQKETIQWQKEFLRETGVEGGANRGRGGCA